MFQDIKWVLLAEALYVLVLILVCIRIVYDTRSVTKTLAYLLFAIFVPFLGIIFYFSFGINYRKRKIYTKKLRMDESFRLDFQGKIKAYQDELLSPTYLADFPGRELVYLLANNRMGAELVLPNAEVKILQNGEKLFPLLLQEMKNAQKHIHIEFYIFDNDTIGNAIKDVMIAKAREGVEVRFIYDDFGSLRIRRGLVNELLASGVEAQPFNRIRLIGLANRLNYRNHRKIVVIDGVTSFVGGINVSDKYINDGSEKLYWRDTHLMIKGYSSLSLQQVFLADWNFCANESLSIDRRYFPLQQMDFKSQKLVQIASSGPDSDLPAILYAVIQAVSKARAEILITTPYYIPDSSLQEVLIVAALSRVDVRLLVPEQGDSAFVNLASQSYFGELLHAGVKIYQYRKGFVHAKTFVVDRKIASVGTANMDARSFDLNFEVSAIVYDEEVASQLAEDFFNDLNEATAIEPDAWVDRPWWRVFVERLLRLLSPFM